MHSSPTAMPRVLLIPICDPFKTNEIKNALRDRGFDVAVPTEDYQEEGDLPWTQRKLRQTDITVVLEYGDYDKDSALLDAIKGPEHKPRTILMTDKEDTQLASLADHRTRFGLDLDVQPLTDLIESIYRSRQPGQGTVIARDNKDETIPPALSLEKYAKVIMETLSRMDVAEKVSLAIFGDWGRGKTFFADHLERLLGSTKSNITIRFSAWKYDSQPEIWSHLYESMLRAAQGRSRLFFNLRLAVMQGGLSSLLLPLLAFQILSAPIREKLAVLSQLSYVSIIIPISILYSILRVTRLGTTLLTRSKPRTYESVLGLQHMISNDLRMLVMSAVRPRNVLLSRSPRKVVDYAFQAAFWNQKALLLDAIFLLAVCTSLVMTVRSLNSPLDDRSQLVHSRDTLPMTTRHLTKGDQETEGHPLWGFTHWLELIYRKLTTRHQPGNLSSANFVNDTSAYWLTFAQTYIESLSKCLLCFLMIVITLCAFVPPEGGRMTLIVDDLDRCPPDVTFTVMKCISLLLDEKGIESRLHIIFLADEQRLKKALALKYRTTKDRRDQNHRRHLEKHFLFWLRLNRLAVDDIKELIQYNYNTVVERRPLSSSKVGSADPPESHKRGDGNAPSDAAASPDSRPGVISTKDEQVAAVLQPYEEDLIRDVIAEAIQSDPPSANDWSPRALRSFMQRYMLGRDLYLSLAGRTVDPRILLSAMIKRRGGGAKQGEEGDPLIAVVTENIS